MLCASSIARGAAAATDHVVVDEYLTRCLDGSSAGAFVELNATGPGQTFDATVGLRLLGPSGGVVADMPGLFAARAGQAWPVATRFLLASSAFEATTGTAPDAVLAGLPATSGGSIVLYRIPAGTSTIIVLDRVDYSANSTIHRLPPAGRSALRNSIGEHLISSEASPTTSTGVLVRAPGCFASAQRPFMLQEVATACLGGDPRGGFVEITPSASSQFMDDDLQLRARDHTGALLFDVPLGLGALTGNAWPQGRAWFVSGPTLVDPGGTGPDLVWPAPLDTVGGTLTLHGADAAGAEVVLAELVYGTPARPAPRPGESLSWDIFQGRFVSTSPASPTGFNQSPRTSSLCEIASSVRVRELLTACGTNAGAGSYIELTATADHEMRDSTLVLKVFDSSGALQSELPAAFGPRAGSAWPVGINWLFTTAGFTDGQLGIPDQLLPLALDPIGGRVEIERAPAPGTTTRELIQSFSWGGSKPAPSPGQALVLVGGSTYKIATANPVNANGTLLRCPAPPDTAIGPVALSVQICAGCLDGTTRGQFVQLNLVTGALLDSNFALRLYDRNQQLIGTLPRLFTLQPGRHAGGSSSWLIGDPNYGVPTDATLPTPLDIVGGSIEAVWLHGGVERASTRITYGPPGPGLAPVGYSITLPNPAPTQQLPTPVDFSGTSRLLVDCHEISVSPVTQTAEICVGCFDGNRRGQFVRLDLIPGALLDSNFVLRIYDHNQQVIGTLPRLFTVLPGTRAPNNASWLIGDPGYGEFGAAPDATLPAPLDLVGGRIEVVSRIAGIERASTGINYGSLGRPLAPGGYSTFLPSSFPLPPRFPSPSNFSGASQVLPGCHFTSASAPGQPYVAEVFPGCINHSAALQYVLIGGPDASLSPDPRIGITISGNDGRLLARIPRLFPDSIPAGGAPGRRYDLLAGPDFERLTGLAPDHVLANPLDTIRDIIALTLTDPISGQTIQISEAECYPAFGRALVLFPGSPSFYRRGGRATRMDGSAATLPPECGDPTPRIPMQLEQLTLGCFDGDLRGQFMELVPSGLDDSLTAEYVLIVRDRAGGTVGEVNPAFGRHRGLPRTSSQHLLFASASMPSPIAIDATLPTVDTLAGSITLVQRSADGERVVWSHRYDRSDPTTPPFGMAIAPTSDSTGSARVPVLENWAGARATLAGCHRGTEYTPPIVVAGVAGACGDGSIGQSYLELTATRAGPVVEGLGLRVSDADGVIDIPLFPDLHALETWTSGRKLLVASDSFAVLTGIRPDRRLPRLFGTTPATVQVHLREPGSLVDRPLTNDVFDFALSPEPGRALQRQPEGGLVSTRAPTITTWDGRAYSLPTACFAQTGLPDQVRLARALFACVDGGTAAQFVQIDRTSALASRTAELRLRLLDHAGTLLGERANLFATTTQVYWGAANSLVIGGPGFETSFQLHPDATLPAVLDTSGGTIQLVLPGPGGDRLLSELDYGARGIQLPPHGSALQWSKGSWSVDSLPVPTGFVGSGRPSVACGARCEVQTYQQSLGGDQISTADSGSFVALGSAIQFDLPHGTLSVLSSFRRSQLVLGDAFTLIGGVAGDALDATVEVTEQHADTCLRSTCLASTRRLVLSVNGAVVDSLDALVRGSARLHARVPFTPGSPTRLQLLAAAEGRLTPPLDAAVTAKLSFALPRASARLVSCHGYDSNRARVVLGAEFHADPHRVELTWSIVADPGFTADVQRLDEADEAANWLTIETRPLEAGGQIRFIDQRVLADHAYRYRLVWFEAGVRRVSDEVAVRVPRSFGFALFSPRPNPSRGLLSVAFELPEASEARLELYDIAGRRVREVRRPFDAGPQSVSLDLGVRLPAGIYTVRLRAAGREARLTVVVLG